MKMMTTSIGIALCFAMACASDKLSAPSKATPTRQATPTKTPTPSAPKASTQTSPPDSTKAPVQAKAATPKPDIVPKSDKLTILLSDNTDLDGDGKPDRIEVECKPDPDTDPGKLQTCFLDETPFVVRVNDSQHVIEDSEVGERYDKKTPKQRFGVKFIDITPKTRDRQLLLELSCGPNECNHHNAYVIQYDGASVKELWHGTPESDIRWRKNGRWSSETTICLKEGKSREDGKGNWVVVKYGTEKVTPLSYRWTGTKVKVKRGKPFKRKADCEIRGRCPFVYAGTEQVFLGEVLRNQVGFHSARPDTISIPRRLIQSNRLVIRITEEKYGETTWIDGISLQVGATRVDPDQCKQHWCKRDQRFFRLPFGRSIELTFSNLPKTGDVRLLVDGYYDIVETN